MRRLCLLIGILLASVVPASAQVSLDASEIYLGSTPCRILSGSGSPESSVTAPVCSTYLRTDSTGGIYTKTSGSGNTGWSLVGLPAPAAKSVLYSSAGGAPVFEDEPELTSLTALTVTAGTVGSGGDLELNPTGKDVLPTNAYDFNLGAINRKWLTLHAAELWVQTLVAQDVMATIGGRVVVGPTTKLIANLPDSDTWMRVEHNELAEGDIVLLEGDGKVEWVEIDSSASVVTGGYQYDIVRDLDGSGENQWYAGDAVLNTGEPGNGYIDLYSVSGVLPGSTAGPTIVGNVRTGSTYNNIAPRWAIGNLNGLYGYSADTYGAAFGDNSNAWLKVDPTNGVRIGHGSTTNLHLEADGDASFAGDITAAGGEIGKWSIYPGSLQSAGTIRAGLFANHVVDTAVEFGGGTNALSRAFNSGTTDNFTLGGWFYLDNTSGNQYPVYIGQYDASVTANRNGYGLVMTSGEWRSIYFAGANTYQAGAGNTASATTWTHVAVRRQGGTTTVFINGAAAGTTHANAPVAPNPGTWAIGALPTSSSTLINGFDGRIAHVFFTQQALSNAQIALMAGVGSGDSTNVAPPLVATTDYEGQSTLFQYYPLDRDATRHLDGDTSMVVNGSVTHGVSGPTVYVEQARVQVGSGTSRAGLTYPLVGSVAIWAGSTYGGRSGAPFRVTGAGAVTATSGTLGGWTLGSTSLTSGSGSTTVGLDSGGTNPALYAGSATPGSAPFRVTAAGALTATSATISGAITATSGSVTGALTVGTSGYIASGATAYGTGTGWIAEYNGGTPRFRIGNPSGSQMRWTGTGLEIFGEGWELSDDAGLAFETAGSDGDLERAVSWAGGSRIFERSGVGALSLIGTGNARINIYSADVCMFADSSSSVCVDADSFSVFNGPLSLGTSGNRWSAVYGDSLYSGDLDGLGTVPVCADNSGKLVAC